MISVVVYGRNDANGYNAHRRVALSLNCMAELLTDPNDEILFVDYNTPDELPTLPEALSDTLTTNCISRTRILRVRAEVHESRFSGMTALPIVEPLARNVAARRSNPANRWLLMTNTDMVFVPHSETSVTDVCEALPDGFYVTPRFELPEWIWEQLPRSDPAEAMNEIRRVGPALRLNETARSHDWLLFDSPGDFQLILRDDFFAIDGLDEQMVLGWHVDANLGKRMLLRRKSIDSLEGELSGYHCNHLRNPTTYVRHRTRNDLSRFVVALEDVDIPTQRATWGLAGEPVEALDLASDAMSEFTSAVLASSRGVIGPVQAIDARNEGWRLEYDSGHVLAYVADSIRVATRPSVFAYVGVNSVLERMLRELLETLVGWPPLSIVPHESDHETDGALGTADVVIVDLGIDVGLLHEPLASARSNEARALRTGLMSAFETFRVFVEIERERVRGGRRARPIVLINSRAIYWNAFMSAQLHRGPTTPHSCVRRATVKVPPDADENAVAAVLHARQLRSWITREDSETRHLVLKPGQRLHVESLDDYAGFGAGWSPPDRLGVSAQGPHTELVVSPSAGLGDDYRLILRFDSGDPLSLASKVTLNDARLGSCELGFDMKKTRGQLEWVIDIPHNAVSSSVAELVLEFDDRPADLTLRSLELRRDLKAPLRQAIRSALHSRRGRTTPRH